MGGQAFAVRASEPRSQDVVTAFCSRSDDGGLTFGPGIPIYTFEHVNGVDLPIAPGTCGGLHGHVRVAPDGTVYVPNDDCLDANGARRPGVAVSTDNGLSWIVRTVPDGMTAGAGASDPSVAAGANNTIYFGYANADGHAKIAVSRDRGQHWTKSADAGTPFGIQNTEFAEVIAGDDDRAAFAFLGTTTAGDTQSSDFLGVWHLYVAFTDDAGRSWTTADATSSDPVQRGCIWNGGGSNPCRNLLDFNDITVDQNGRMLVGYADGCTGTCVTDPTQNASTGPATAQDALATIARQVGGRGRFAALDGTQFGTKTGDNKGGGTLCFGAPATGRLGVAGTAPGPAKTGGASLTPREFWRRQFHRSARERSEDREAEGESRPRATTGIGDEAYWAGNRIAGALYVLHRDTFMRISVGGIPSERERIEKSKALARAAVRRL